jgi:hypothetical protein
MLRPKYSKPVRLLPVGPTMNLEIIDIVGSKSDCRTVVEKTRVSEQR